jgi:hypothetical protein
MRTRIDRSISPPIRQTISPTSMREIQFALKYNF